MQGQDTGASEYGEDGTWIEKPAQMEQDVDYSCESLIGENESLGEIDRVELERDAKHTSTYENLLDPTYNWDVDTFEDTVPVEDVSMSVSKCGVRGTLGKTPLLPTDGEQLLKVRRNCGANARDTSSVSRFAFQVLRGECDFIPELVFKALCASYPEVRQLQRLLSQDWVRTWNGWKKVAEELDGGMHEDIQQVIVDDFIVCFTSLCMDLVVFTYPSDKERKRSLQNQGYTFGVGSGYAFNCLSDSLLQLLISHKIIRESRGNGAQARWRHDACEAVRRHLCEQPDESLRPRERDHANRIRDVSEEDHARAFLEHHKHAAAIVQFLILFAGTDDVHISRGCRLVVFSRFDGDDIDPEQDAIFIGCDESSSMPAQTLLLYNNTGNGTSGMHYDPVFPPGIAAARASGRTRNPSVVGTPKATAKPSKRKVARNVEAEEEKPFF